MGIALADLLPEPSGPAEPELLVTTISGDIFAFDASTLQVEWRSHVPGGLGCYNSMRVATLDSVGGSQAALYVAGSFGLWRFNF